MADAGGGITLMQGAQSGSDLFGRPALMHQFAANPIVQRAALNQLGARPAQKPSRIMNRAGHLRVIGRIAQPPPRQFPPDRAGRAAQQPADLPQARPAPMLRQNHATFLAVEVLASSVHRNILSPAGRGLHLKLEPKLSGYRQ